jgi:NAD(P)-dependent dehydrogenase (short-subunit alcohol dehydrogenase family)
MKTVLITGASRGFGLELAKQYAAEGWAVLACVRRTSPALAGLAGLQPAVEPQVLDVSEFEEIERLARRLAGRPIDVLINNAAILGRHPVFDDQSIQDQSFGRTDYADWERVLRTNLLAPMKMAECFVEHVAASTERKLVTFSSMLGSVSLNSLGGLYQYRTSKAAVNAMMKSMGIDLGKRGILACAIHPGWARTDMGGVRATEDPVAAIRGVRRVIAGLTSDQVGQVLAFDGSVVPY